MDVHYYRITKSELEGLALAAAAKAVQECQTSFMSTLGININNQDAIEEFRATVRFAENLRLGTTKVGARVGMTAITVVAGAVAIASWEWLKAFFHFVK